MYTQAMPLSDFFSRRPAWALAASAALGLCLDSMAAPPLQPRTFSLIGARSWSSSAVESPAEPRVNVLETDSWRQSLKDGSLRPEARYPLPPRGSTDLLPRAHFTPAAYLEKIESLRNLYSFQRDILMYYGGIRYHPNAEGLNFNGWSGPDLRQLRLLGARPFIGLETFDRAAITSMVWRLKEAGYGPLHRVYVRIGSEPSFSAYGTEEGVRGGKRGTPKAWAAYQQRFMRAAETLNGLNRRLGMNVHNVFAGASRQDFTRYIPPDYAFDAIGYDLYVTPENKSEALRQIAELSRKYPRKPLVIPEFGIATERHAAGWFGPRTVWADPQWAADSLADVLVALGRHPAGIGEITVFSVNVSGRRKDRRWNWAWTPQMYEMLKEWQSAPRRWRKEGFHRYDPQSYPVGRDVLFLNHPDLRIVYRRLGAEKSPGVSLFQEYLFFRENSKWRTRSQIVYFQGGEKRLFRSGSSIL